MGKYLRNTLTKTLGGRDCSSSSSVKDDINLYLISNCDLQSEDSSVYLHGSAINEKTIQSLNGLCSTVRALEDDGCNATADSSRSIRNLNFLDRSNRLGEVFLSAPKKSR